MFVLREAYNAITLTDGFNFQQEVSHISKSSFLGNKSMRQHTHAHTYVRTYMEW